MNISPDPKSIIKKLEALSKDISSINISDLINVFKTIIIKTQTSIEYRVTTEIFSWAMKELSTKEDSLILPLILQLIQTFRNVIAQIQENQNQAFKHEWNKKTEVILWHVSSKLKPNGEPNEFLLIIRSGIQALSNIITVNDYTKRLILSEYMNRNESRDLLSDIFMKSKIGMNLLKTFLEKTDSLFNCNSGEQFVEIVYSMVSNLINFGYYPIMFDYLTDSSSQIPSKNQLVLIKFLEAMFDTTSTIVSENIKITEDDDSTTINNFSINSCISLAKSLNNISPTVISILIYKKPTSSSPPTVPVTSKLYDDDGISHLLNVLTLILQCIAALTCKCDKQLHECLFKENVIECCINLLNQADKSIPRITKAATSNNDHSELRSSPSSPRLTTSLNPKIFMNIKKDLVNVISYMSYDNIKVQNKVRKLGGIQLILNQCNIDDNNPFIREHSIFAIRNLLHNNLENQKLVQELSPIEVMQHPILSDIGSDSVKESIKKPTSSSPPTVPVTSKLYDDDGISHLLNVLTLILQCIAALTCKCDKQLHECLFKENVIECCINLLNQADKSIPRITKAATSNNDHSELRSSPSSPRLTTSLNPKIFMNIKKDLVNVISYMSYDNIKVQNKVRKLGGIQLILNQCNIDDNNPFIREHSIFAIRNLLHNNLENQKLVQELSPIEVMQHPILSDIGEYIYKGMNEV
ncbi:521_t:CDS:10 [Entrophospora sp. SA101]|nr:521_t:CDS:10 [Entrophospora sp. SA101]